MHNFDVNTKVTSTFRKQQNTLHCMSGYTRHLEHTVYTQLIVFQQLNKQLLFPGPEEDDQVLFNDELPHTGQRSSFIKWMISLLSQI